MRRWWLLIGLAACTELGDVERDRCGNGVVEPSRGEDCDRGDADDPTCGAAGTAVECRLLCGSNITGEPTCPAGAVCGSDSVCHAPDRTFGVTADTRWTARSLLVGDTTDDGFPELVGVSDEEIVALLGAPEGTYSTSLAVPNLPVFDEPRMSDINGDGLQDLTIPVGFGLYSLAGDDALVLEPLFQNSFPVPGEGRLVSASIDHFVFDTTGQVPGPIPNAETMAALHLPMGPNCPQPAGCDVLILGDGGAALPAGKRIQDIADDTVPWAWVPGAVNQRFIAALAFPDDLQTQPNEGGVYLYRGDLTASPPTLIAIAGPATVSGTVVGRAWFADVDGDGLSDLLARTLIFGNESVSVSWGRADGAFEAPQALVGGPGPSRLGTDALHWGDLNGDRKADYVSASGYIEINACVGRTGNCFATALTTEREWVEARIVDVDGDGKNDVVARGPDAIVVDVLRNSGLPAVWNDAPLTVPGTIKALRVGDFDGNGSGDVAVVTTTPGVVASDGLYIAYGRSGDGLAPATYMGYVGTHVALQPTTSLIPGRFDYITDLLVVAERGGSRGAALVLGSTSQRMIGPLIPIGDDAVIASATVEGVVSLPIDGDDTDDVICLISQTFNNGQAPSAIARVFTSSSDGALTEVSPAAGVTLEVTDFFLRGARWVTVPARDGEPAYVIGADFFGRVAAIPINCNGASCGAGTIQALTPMYAGDPLDLDTVDLDSDGDLDLVGAFRPLAMDPQSPVAHIRVWINSNGYSTATEITAPAGHVIAATAAIDLDLDGRRELFALVRGAQPGLYVARPQDGGGYGPLESAATMTADDVELGGGITLVGDDLTGDGLPDLVGVFGPEGSPQNIKVLAQRERRGALAAPTSTVDSP
ncbi:MAG TPA: VCBS repeat-containing protein [Kofleriaceae bacterium]|nr:VCBS repeat-containing protein [Kofleriaceae bacterium]